MDLGALVEVTELQATCVRDDIVGHCGMECMEDTVTKDLPKENSNTLSVALP